MTIRTFRTEFPGFDPATLPAIPADWTDVSWKNDACPSFLAAAGPTWEILVFVDWADPAERELGGASRYSVQRHANDGDDGACSFSSDSWPAIVACVNALATALRRADRVSAEQKGA